MPKGQWLDAYEPRAGGRIQMAVNWDGARVSYDGEIKLFEPPKILTFENDWIGFPIGAGSPRPSSRFA
jgi:hypothetical protein